MLTLALRQGEKLTRSMAAADVVPGRNLKIGSQRLY